MCGSVPFGHPPPHALWHRNTAVRTTNWKPYNQALIQRGSLSIWLDTSMSWQATPQHQRGTAQTYSDTGIQFCLTIKNLFRLTFQSAIGFIQSLLKLAGLDWTVPDYSTLSRYQQTLQVKIPYQKSSGALHLLVDSTGIKVLGERVMARRFDSQVEELQVRAAILNRFSMLCRPCTVAVA